MQQVAVQCSSRCAPCSACIPACILHLMQHGRLSDSRELVAVALGCHLPCVRLLSMLPQKSAPCSHMSSPLHKRSPCLYPPTGHAPSVHMQYKISPSSLAASGRGMLPQTYMLESTYRAWPWKPKTGPAALALRCHLLSWGCLKILSHSLHHA